MALRDTAWVVDSNSITITSEPIQEFLTIVFGSVTNYSRTRTITVKKWVALTKAGAVAGAAARSADTKTSARASEVNRVLGAYEVTATRDSRTDWST